MGTQVSYIKKECMRHSPEGGGDLKKSHFAKTNIVTLLGRGGGMRFPFFGVTYFLHGHLYDFVSSYLPSLKISSFNRNVC